MCVVTIAVVVDTWMNVGIILFCSVLFFLHSPIGRLENERAISWTDAMINLSVCICVPWQVFGW